MDDERALLLAVGTHSPYLHQIFYHLCKDDPSALYTAHKEMMASVCQKCGDPGFKELLVHCRKCKISAEHRYCLYKFPKPEERVCWFCEQCEPSSTLASLGKLVIGNGRSNDDLKCDDQQKDYSDIPMHQDKRRAISNHGETVLPKFPSPQDKKQVTSIRYEVIPLPKMQNDETNGSEHKKIEGEIRPCTYPEKDEGGKSKRRRRLLLQEGTSDHVLLTDHGYWNVINKAIELPPGPVSTLPPSHTISCDEIVQEKVHDDQPNVQCNRAPSNQHPYSVAQPIINPVWRGYIYFGDEKYGPLTAHVSTIACERVFNTAKLLPAVLQMEKFPRLQCCPNSFKNGPPTDDKIGLYFFVGGTKVDSVLDQLLDDAIHKDLLFRFMFNEAELLVFSSTILHQDHQKFQGKYYLWGAFRGRQASVSSSSANCHSRPNKLGVDEVSYHAGEKEEGGGHDDECCELSNFVFSPLSVLQHPPRSNEPREETPRPEGLSKLAGDKGGVEVHDREKHKDYELEEGEIYERYLDREKVDGGYGDNPSRSNEPREETPRSEDLSKLAGDKGDVEIHDREKHEDYELEEGEIYEREREDGDNPEDSNQDGLQFLPLASEDMGIVSKYGSCNELNLELGLCRRKVGNDRRDLLAVLNSFPM